MDGSKISPFSCIYVHTFTPATCRSPQPHAAVPFRMLHYSGFSSMSKQLPPSVLPAGFTSMSKALPAGQVMAFLNQ